MTWTNCVAGWDRLSTCSKTAKFPPSSEDKKPQKGNAVVSDSVAWLREQPGGQEIDRLRDAEKLALSAVYLLKAATGPEDGPTSWSETRDTWMRKAEALFQKEQST